MKYHFNTKNVFGAIDRAHLAYQLHNYVTSAARAAGGAIAMQQRTRNAGFLVRCEAMAMFGGDQRLGVNPPMPATASRDAGTAVSAKLIRR